MSGTMNHHTTSKYWQYYNSLPEKTKILAKKNFKILKKTPNHPSLHLKKIKKYWSVRVGIHYRALGIDTPDQNGIIWFWIGSHEAYNKLIKK